MDQAATTTLTDTNGLPGPNISSGLNKTVIMPWESAHIKENIVHIISQWLADEGFGAARQALLEEAGLKLREREDEKNEKRKLRTYLLGMCCLTNERGKLA